MTQHLLRNATRPSYVDNRPWTDSCGMRQQDTTMLIPIIQITVGIRTDHSLGTLMYMVERLRIM
jgi:hypothetical protein